MIDASLGEEDMISQLEYVKEQLNAYLQPKHLIVFNKCDLAADSVIENLICGTRVKSLADNTLCDAASGNDEVRVEVLRISARTGKNIDMLESTLVDMAKSEHDPESELIVTNARHHAELQSGLESLRRVREGLETGLSADFIAQDVREALHHFGTVTGAVTTDTLLTTIFTRFCIGK